MRLIPCRAADSAPVPSPGVEPLDSLRILVVDPQPGAQATEPRELLAWVTALAAMVLAALRELQWRARTASSAPRAASCAASSSVRRTAAPGLATGDRCETSAVRAASRLPLLLGDHRRKLDRHVGVGAAAQERRGGKEVRGQATSLAGARPDRGREAPEHARRLAAARRPRDPDS